MNKQTSSAGTMASMGLLLVVSVLVTPSTGFGDDDGSTDYFRGHESNSGYNGYSSNNNNNNNKQLPVILMHKQALQQDGGFQYAFAADNGLRQGESIRPDGSRTGAYSYTDPDGKEISVKYTAGKDGFRIVQGDHVPKAPVSLAAPALPAAVQSAAAVYSPPAPGRSTASGKNRLFGVPGGPGSQFSRGSDLNSVAKFYPNSGESYGSPSPYKSKYSKPQQHYRVREDISAEAPRFDDDGSSSFDGTGDYSSHSPFRAPSSPAQFDNSQKDEGSFGSDERQPHTFGNGYAFEFGNVNNDGPSTEF